MTRKVAIDRLMSIFYAEEKWRSFFERMVNEMNGEGNTVSESTFEEIRKYIAKMT